MKQRIFQALFCLAGFGCLLFLVYAKYPSYFKSTTASRTNAEYRGEVRRLETLLYRTAGVYDLKPRDFKGCSKVETRPVVVDKPQSHDINEARVIFFGDSFIKGFFGRDFERHTGIPTYSHRDEGMALPTEVILEEGLIPSESGGKVLVYEMVERNIVRKIGRIGPMEQPADSLLDRMDAYLKETCALDPDSIELLLRRNRLISTALFARGTFRFRTFGLIHSNSPVYSLDPPMLFYHAEVSCNSRKNVAKGAAAMAGNLSRLSDELMSRFGIRLIFMPIPNKISIYGHYAGVKYNGLLPELYRRLDEQGVEYVNLYDDYVENPDFLYHMGGSHWNYKGSAIAEEKLIRMIEGGGDAPRE